jgi:hypothetical protein
MVRLFAQIQNGSNADASLTPTEFNFEQNLNDEPDADDDALSNSDSDEDDDVLAQVDEEIKLSL